jgi:hypothetical protein
LEAQSLLLKATTRMSSSTPPFDVLSALFRTRRSSGSSKRSSSSYVSYSVYQQNMFPIIFRDPEATRKLLEAILDSPGGKRSLSRLARTCKAMSDLALNILWKELDSLVPIIGLFPSHLLRKARKPGLGLVRPGQMVEYTNGKETVRQKYPSRRIGRMFLHTANESDVSRTTNESITLQRQFFPPSRSIDPGPTFSLIYHS